MRLSVVPAALAIHRFFIHQQAVLAPVSVELGRRREAEARLSPRAKSQAPSWNAVPSSLTAQALW